MKITKKVYERIIKSMVTDIIINHRMCYGISMMMSSDFNRENLYSNDFQGLNTLFDLIGIGIEGLDLLAVREIEDYFKKRLKEDSLLNIKDRPDADDLAALMTAKINELKIKHIARHN